MKGGGKKGTPPTLAVFTIPAGAPFADALAAGLLKETGGDAAELARARVFLPTRRACRTVGDAFLRVSLGRPLLLPGLIPLGDIDEDELVLAQWRDQGGAGEGGLDLPPAMPEMRRVLLLARLIQGRLDTSPEQAARLAAELARFMDQVHIQGLSFDGLADLAPQDHAEHWGETLEFLKIVTERWPDILAEEGCLDGAQRRDRLLRARAAAWRRHPPDGIVVAAGSTGSIPATAELIEVIAGLPRGCVVLPGLDRELDPESVCKHPSHPQYGMMRLLDRLGVAPDRVGEWPTAIEGTARARGDLVNRALVAAELTESWGRLAPLEARAVSGVSLVECPTPKEEAGVIALILRQALETGGRTAALVTPDRALARRVASELGRWDVRIDDSAGRPLASTPPGAFLRLTAAMAVEEVAPVPLLAALKHPLAGGGMARAALRTTLGRLELAVLRGPRPAPGIDGLAAALDDDQPSFAGLLEVLARALAPFSGLLAGEKVPLRRLLRAHVEMAETLAATDELSGAARLWAGDAGEAAASFVAELADAAASLEPLGGSDYPALLDALMAGRVVRPRHGGHPRLAIWGPLEARLQHADVLVLGGLNEGTWPPEAAASPWMSRPMMEDFGLPRPELRIGLAAHDFAQAFAAPEVVLTRSVRVDGTPAVPSRWLSRLETLLIGSGLEGALGGGQHWLAWFQELDQPAPGEPVARPVAQPEPRPPVPMRPRRLSVTRVETLIRDPYAIYARHILGLKPLDPLDADPGAAERGIIVHGIFERFLRDRHTGLPEDALDALIAIGRQAFRDKMAWPGVRAFWWPRFLRTAGWFLDNERRRRQAGFTTLATEVEGKMEFDAPGGTFLLTALADRIDRDAGGGLCLIDYKTGQAPSWKQVKSGLAPQLTLEAAIAAAGGFEGLAAEEAGQLAYLRLTGGREPGEELLLDEEIAVLAEQTRRGLERLIAYYDDPDTPYRSRTRPKFAAIAGDYDHLARVKEWIAGVEEDA